VGSGDQWVVDTSPLIFLAKLDRLALLQRRAKRILVPPAVIEEVRRHPDAAALEVEAALSSWLELRPVEDRRLVAMLRADLGSGEAEVLALAQKSSADRVVMDDLEGRRYVHRLGLSVVGTLGLLLVARQAGEIPCLGDDIERLRAAGFRASDQLVEAVLRTAGELI
jgi:predicted nucleic acid-binding protein